MELKRKIYKKLIEWKKDVHHKALVIKGPRQVGKTFIIEKFAKENYESVVKINFSENIKYKEIFDDSLNVDDIITKIKLYIDDAKFIEGKTLIFLDEIQLGGNAITALKFFTIDKRYDVICSGSMLGFYHKEVNLFPVGYYDLLDMHGLDFEEFLIALGVEKKIIENLKNNLEQMITASKIVNDKMIEYFKTYIVVGGMPEVVADYILNKDLKKVYKIQNTILDGYMSDVTKYAKNTDKEKIRKCFNSIPKHLLKDYKKFRYSLVEHNGTRTKFENSIDWLIDAGVVNICYNLSKLNKPLEAYKVEDEFKIYMRDTGLLVAMLGENTAKEILLGDIGAYKGAIYENIIADIFTKNGIKLFYFERKSRLEIDFVMICKEVLTCIEVKSADNTKSKSLKTVIENHNVQSGIKLSTKNLGSSENKVSSIPIYMAMFIR